MKKLFLMLCIVVLFSQSLLTVHADGSAAVVMDATTGRVLYEQNPHQTMAMASTTKIMTALLAIENTLTDHVVKINPEAAGIEGSSIYLKANEKISMVDLLYGLMLRSGNDAAAAIAFEIGGSIEHFAALMNQRAQALGATQTNFMNPHGLHHDDHYTTAYDLALITRAALQEPLFKTIVSSQFWKADRADYAYFTNKNKTLTTCEGGDGVKTGYTTKSGRCLVASATREGMQFIAVTLNDPDWFLTADQLLDSAFEAYLPHQALEKEEIVGQLAVLEGKQETLPLITEKEVILPLREEEIDQLEMVIETVPALEAPLMKGEKAGTVTFLLNQETLFIADLVTGEGVERLTWQDKVKSWFNRN